MKLLKINIRVYFFISTVATRFSTKKPNLHATEIDGVIEEWIYQSNKRLSRDIQNGREVDDLEQSIQEKGRKGQDRKDNGDGEGGNAPRIGIDRDRDVEENTNDVNLMEMKNKQIKRPVKVKAIVMLIKTG